MLNAANKTILFGLISAIIAAGCSGRSNQDHDAAQSLLEQATVAVGEGEFDKAKMLLDSMSATYPKEVEVGREAMKLRPAIIEGTTIAELAERSAELQYLSLAAQAYAAQREEIKLADEGGMHYDARCYG